MADVQAPGPADLRAAVVLRLRALETAGIVLSDAQRAMGQHLVATFATWEHGWPAASTRVREVGCYEAWMAATGELLKK